MGSKRFPGKALAPLAGRPIIRHMLDSLNWTPSLLTTWSFEDDPLALYVSNAGYEVIRGPEDILDRFRYALERDSCKYFVRLCGDSPFICSRVVDIAIGQMRHSRADLVSTRGVLPSGLHVEVVRTKSFLEKASLVEQDSPLVSLYRWGKVSQLKGIGALGSLAKFAPLAVDTVDDLKRLEEQFRDIKRCIGRAL